jgi:hypothetical protein
MSQCCTRKRRITLNLNSLVRRYVGCVYYRESFRFLNYSITSLCIFFLVACSVADLEDFATQRDPGDIDIRQTEGYGDLPPGADKKVLVPVESIFGGAQARQSVGGQISKFFIGPDDEVKLRRPVSVSGTDGWLFIVDAEQRTVFKYDLNEKTIEPLSDVIARISGDPGNIYVANDASFYIVDQLGKKVLHFNERGDFVGSFDDAVNLSRPMDVFVDEPSGDVYVADGSYSHIVVFNQFGNPLRAIGKRGTGPGRFRAITSMAQSLEGIFVIDRLELPVQLITDRGEFRYSMGEANHVYPTAVAVGENGWVFVSDQSDNKIRVYVNKRLVDSVGGTGHAPARFRKITSMWANQDLLYVADSLNQRVQVLRMVPQNLHLWNTEK